QQPEARLLSSKNPFRNRGAVSPATFTHSSSNSQSPSYTTPTTTTPALNQGHFAPINGTPAAAFTAVTAATATGGLSPTLVNPLQQQLNNSLSPPLAPVSPMSPIIAATSPGVGAVQQQQQPPPAAVQPLQQTLFGPSLRTATPQLLSTPRPMSTNPFLSEGESVAFSAFIEQQTQQQMTSQNQSVSPAQQQQQQQATPLRQPRMADLDGF
ncbi:hypothetical protein KEM54_002031, partial [Ascosphaera aggregata]